MTNTDMSLRDAAQAVIDRWETPLWKDALATAVFIADLRKALARDAGRASLSANAGEPMFWVRLCGDGLYEGPIHNARIEEVRKQSGVWSPLYLAAPPTAQAEGLTWTVLNSGAQVVEVESLAEAMEYLTPARLARQWCAVCVVDQSNLPPTSAEGVEHADQA